jgi:glycosyltransferase 2 family protein
VSLLLRLLRTALALGLLVWVIRRLQWEEIAGFDWAGISLGWLGLAFLLGGLSLLGWAGRWWWFVRVYGLRVPFRELLRLTMFADFFNLYFLGPLGADGVRLLHLARSYPERRGAIVGSLVLDHVGGLFGGFILYACFVSASGLPVAITSMLDKALPFVALVTFLGLGVIMEPPVQRLFGQIPGLWRIAAWMSPLFAGTFRHPWLFSGFAVSTLSTASAFAAYWAAARAVGADLDLTQMLGLMPAVDLVASLPISISGLGVREGLLVEWLGSQPDCGPVRALSTSLLGFAAIGLWGLIGGLWLLFSKRQEAVVTPP